ncbi:MAG: hypothetical protein JXA20_05830 [Spirochaetes bacterium]|nr:hypothetical protein [Spirochaetota bacterium]
MLQLSRLLSENDAKTVFNEVERVYWLNYSASSYLLVKRCYKEITRLFKGGIAGYKACNTEYHDLAHTIDSMLAAIRLLDGYNMTNEHISETVGRNCLIAALFHDTGYIQEDSDGQGTGAKHIARHLERSIKFLEKNHELFSIDAGDIDSIRNILLTTGSDVDEGSIRYNSQDEITAGKILGSANLLGQMAQREYLEKLLFLYYEYREANIPGFDTEFDILRKTVDFYENVKIKFAEKYDSVHKYSRHHFKARYDIDGDLYFEAIDKNIAYLQRIIDDATTNFRSKLKRGDWMSLEKAKLQHQVQ